MKKEITKFFDQIDLSKRYPDHIDKRILRIGFIFVLIIQMIALTMTGFNFNPAWAECNYDICENPFYQATGKVCDQNPNLCTTETLSRGEILGNKPPKFAMIANGLSWICLWIAGIINYLVCKKRRYERRLMFKKRTGKDSDDSEFNKKVGKVL